MSTHTDNPLTERHERHEHHVHIFVNRREITVHERTITGARLLDIAGFEGHDWDLLELHGAGDPTGGTLVLADTEITLHNEERFRVVPGNRTFGGR